MLLLASERMSLLPDLRRDGKKICDGNHNLVESEEAIAPTKTHAAIREADEEWGKKQFAR